MEARVRLRVSGRGGGVDMEKERCERCDSGKGQEWAGQSIGEICGLYWRLERWK